MGWLGVMGSAPAAGGAGEGVGGRGVGAEFFAQDAKARVGGEAEFDLFAPNTGNDDLYRPLGKEVNCGVYSYWPGRA